MPRVRIESAKERKPCVVAVPVVAVFNEQVNHPAPVFPGRPHGIKLSYNSGAHNRVAGVEIVVVDLVICAVLRRIAG